MMFKARFGAVLVASLASATAALAGPGGSGKSFNVSWQEFQARCADPDSFDNQRAPREIRIQCTNVERDFVQDAPGAVPLDNNRHVIATILSDKFNVASMDKSYPVASKPGSCVRYKEIEKTITIERPLTCADVLGIKGDVNDFCASSLDMAKGTSPKLIDTRETGNRIDTCGGAAAPGKSK